MMDKLSLTVIIAMVLVLGVTTIHLSTETGDELKKESRYKEVTYMEGDSEVYQGPVRPTDDEEYFRETGITKPLEE